jgi:hypothetical protein
MESDTVLAVPGVEEVEEDAEDDSPGFLFV